MFNVDRHNLGDTVRETGTSDIGRIIQIYSAGRKDETCFVKFPSDGPGILSRRRPGSLETVKKTREHGNTINRMGNNIEKCNGEELHFLIFRVHTSIKSWIERKYKVKEDDIEIDWNSGEIKIWPTQGPATTMSIEDALIGDEPCAESVGSAQVENQPTAYAQK